MARMILVVDDERKIVTVLKGYLEQAGFGVVTAGDGQMALTTFRHQRPDLVILDLMLPGIDGLDVCRILRRESTVPIIMLTARAEEADRLIGLELGADDYIVKPFSFRELVSRVRAALRRAYGELAAAGGERVSFGDVVVDLQRMRAEKAGQNVQLTPTEYRLLRHLVTHPDQVFSRDSLLEIVWGYDSGVDSQRTVDVHVRHLREKLEGDPAVPRWLVTVRGAGYMFTQKT